MTQDEIIDMAIQAGISEEIAAFNIPIIEAFAKLIAAKERQRTWVGLTNEEVESYWDWEDFQTGAGRLTILKMVRDIESKLKERNA